MQGSSRRCAGAEVPWIVGHRLAHRPTPSEWAMTARQPAPTAERAEPTTPQGQPSQAFDTEVSNLSARFVRKSLTSPLVSSADERRTMTIQVDGLGVGAPLTAPTIQCVPDATDGSKQLRRRGVGLSGTWSSAFTACHVARTADQRARLASQTCPPAPDRPGGAGGGRDDCGRRCERELPRRGTS